MNMVDGRQRLMVPMESGSQISQIVDKHPYSLVLSNHGWIYMFDSTKYTIEISRCPYIGAGTWIYVSNPYSQYLYVLT